MFLIAIPSLVSNITGDGVLPYLYIKIKFLIFKISWMDNYQMLIN